MEKVMLTVEQIENIKELSTHESPLGTYRDNSDYYDALRCLPIDIVARAIYVGYKVIPMFKVGDIVTDTTTKGVGKIEQVLDLGRVKVEGLLYNRAVFRHATMSEVVNYRRQQWWKAMDRKDMEFHNGDVVILKDPKSSGYTTRALVVGVNLCIATAQDLLMKNNIDSIYPNEDRRYVPQSDWEWDN